jgi:uncharacterized membrane protein
MTTHNKVSYSLTDKLLELAGIALSIAIILLPMVYYAGLPDEIPTHFNFKGLPDAWSHKSAFWSLPVIAVVLYLGLSLLNYFMVMKQNVKISGNNDHKMLQQVLRLMQVLKLSLNIGFLYIIFGTIRVAQGDAQGLGIWFLPVFIIVMTFVPLIFVVKIAANTGAGKRK